MKRKLRRTICLALVLLTWLCTLGAGTAELYGKSETIRLGFGRFPGYYEMDKEGNRSGYGYEYLQHLAVYGNWNYEYLCYDGSWAEQQSMLEEGELDMLTGVQKTPERMEIFEFSNQAMGYSNTMITVAAGNNQYFPNNFEEWDGVRVGLIENYNRNANFEAFAEEKGFTYETVYYGNVTELVEALKQGEDIDMAVTSNLRNVEGEWILAEFDPSPFYICVKKGNTELMNRINGAMSQLTLYETSLESDLWDKYYYDNSNTEIAYTCEERNFIENMAGTTFTAIISPDCAPLSYVEGGQPTGILYDITQKVIERTGLNIEVIVVEDRAEYMSILENRQCDICLDTWYEFSRAEEQGYSLSLPYVSTSISALRQKGNAQVDSIAAIKGMNILNYYTEKLYPGYEVVYYDTMEEAIKAVKQGEQDEVLLYTRCAEYAVNQDITNRLVTEKLRQPEPQFSVAVNNRENTLLLSIFSKACSSVSEEEIAECIMKYNNQISDDFSILGYLYKHPVMALASILVLLGVILMIIATIYTVRARRHEHQRVLEETQKNELLQDALSVAQQAVKAKSTFLSRISHEMRTPLNAIIGYMHLAQEEEETPEDRASYIHKAEVAANQLLSLIKDVLDASALESDKMKITAEVFRISDIPETMRQIFAPMAREKQIDFQMEMQNVTLDYVKGDATRVSQILINLLSNAMKFTKNNGKVTLIITQKAQRERYVFYEFTVKDNGIGMDSAFLEKIGEPFEQEHGQIGVRYGGTGLGVSIVKMLTSLMNGKVTVASQKLEGTEFRVEIPFEIGEESAITTEQKENKPKQKKYDFKGKRILVAEDNQMNMEIMLNMLERNGFVVTCALNGQEAVDLFAESKEHEFAAVLMDIQMPLKNGYEAVEEIRMLNRSDADTVPILAITANAFEEDVAASLAAGMNEHISKPIDFRLLFDKLNQLIE